MKFSIKTLLYLKIFLILGWQKLAELVEIAKSLAGVSGISLNSISGFSRTSKS